MPPEQARPAEMFEDFIGAAIFVPWTKLLLEIADVQAGDKVLDLACATGIVARQTAPLIADSGRIAALDISPEMLSVGRERSSNGPGEVIEWVPGDACSIPFPDDSFSLVICQQGLQFFDDKSGAVSEIRRVLEPDGRAILSVWQGLERQPAYRALLEAEAEYLDAPIDEVALPFSYGDEGELRELLEVAGFAGVEIIDRSHQVHFPQPDKFAALTIMAGAAVVPGFDQDEADRSRMIEAVKRKADAQLRQFHRGDTISFPMHTHIAVATAAKH